MLLSVSITLGVAKHISKLADRGADTFPSESIFLACFSNIRPLKQPGHTPSQNLCISHLHHFSAPQATPYTDPNNQQKTPPWATSRHILPCFLGWFLISWSLPPPQQPSDARLAARGLWIHRGRPAALERERVFRHQVNRWPSDGGPRIVPTFQYQGLSRS